MKVKLLVAGAVLGLGLAVPMAASADSCANVSRPAPTNYDRAMGPLIQGNRVWLPSIGVPFQAWGFATPGTIDSIEGGFPGANGNYTNGQTASLLGMSAYCTDRGKVIQVRQTDHGIQAGCE